MEKKVKNLFITTAMALDSFQLITQMNRNVEIKKRVLTQENTQENNIPNRYFMLLITKFWKVRLKI
jgi:hypothetical protein